MAVSAGGLTLLLHLRSFEKGGVHTRAPRIAGSHRRLSSIVSTRQDLLTPDDRGLACHTGGFHVDPWMPVHRAVITHAHADHARAGHGEYICTPDTAAVIRKRISPDLNIIELEHREPIDLGNTRVSLHPAGHVLGSAQARIEHASGETWVVTGDYKTDPDRACEPFELVPCDAFVTESTFALPIYTWRPQEEVAREINDWWRENRDAGRTSLLFAYALGKAQRVISLLDRSIAPVGAHGAVKKLCDVYAERGVDLGEVIHARKETAPDLRAHGALIVAPPSVDATPWTRRFRGPGGSRTAFASGWMRVRGRRRWRAADRGFVLSDHADWPGLIRTIKAVGASRVFATHGYAAPLARYVTENLGLEGAVLPTRRGDLPQEDAFDLADEDAS